MGSPERIRSSTKRESEEDVEVNIDSVKDDEDWDCDDKRKQRSSKSRKEGSGENLMDWIAVEEKEMKKKPEENTLDVLSTWYQDGETENKLDVAEKHGSRGYSRAEESERKKSTSKYSEHDTDVEKLSDRDSRDSVRRDNSREKGYGYAEHGRRRRWDEPDNIVKTVEYGEKSEVKSGKSTDPKLEGSSERERSDTLENESIDVRSRGFESMNDKGVKFHERGETS
ncbi:hypothetical protein Sango_0757800 [Sesamum angolense]|uniref:Uncharacterized protein n=1 Tax=Sesamum angolense TaxID=2727404 RepID=A0AAE2BZW0_9LAMI|nr:hypothetical protein Sango_0757800 [Sesamum angolense]